MQIKTFKAYKPNTMEEIHPIETLKENLKSLDWVIKNLVELKPNLVDDYVSAVIKRLVGDITPPPIDTSSLDFDVVIDGITSLNNFPELQEAVIQSTFNYLNLPKRYQPNSGKITVTTLNNCKAMMLLQFHRTKAFVDILGREAGIRLWKEIVSQYIDDLLKTIEERPPIKEMITEQEIQQWVDSGGQDFTVVIFDDYKFLLKVDRCVVYESVKHLNDPEIAYLAYCYTGDVGDARDRRIRRRRRTQTVYLGEFCDEFYWNNDVHPEAEQPSLEFMQKLGKEDPAKIIAKYQDKS